MVSASVWTAVTHAPVMLDGQPAQQIDQWNPGRAH